MDYFWDAIENTLGIKDHREIPALSAAGKEAVRILYDGEVRYADEEVARLLSHVKKNHEDTLVIFISDHGEEFWERGSMGHGLTMYEEQLHVPFLIHGPGIEPIRVEASVSTLDILPTVASYLGLKPEKFWQGRNLLHEPEAAAVPIFSKTRAAEPRANINQEAVVFDGYKYIVDAVSDKQFLYNLKDDPGELHNLLKEMPDLAIDLARRLEEQHARDIELGKALLSTETSKELSSEIREQLRQLGYTPE
jgi:arylsulfatase A-like enzyme